MLYCILYSDEQATRRIWLGMCSSSAHLMGWLSVTAGCPRPSALHAARCEMGFTKGELRLELIRAERKIPGN